MDAYSVGIGIQRIWAAGSRQSLPKGCCSALPLATEGALSPASHLELRHELATGAEGDGFTTSLGPRQVVTASVLEGTEEARRVTGGD